MNELKELIKRNSKKLLLMGLALTVLCFFLGSSFLSLIHNKMELKRLQKATVLLDEQHQALQKRLALLKKQDPAYIERVARVKYHMSQKGEIEFRFKPE